MAVKVAMRNAAAAGEKWTYVSTAKWVTNALVISTTTTVETTGGSWDSMKIYFLEGLLLTSTGSQYQR